MGFGNQDLIIYLNDDNTQRTAFCKIIEINQSYVKFETGSNVLTIPFSRILKIKERGK